MWALFSSAGVIVLLSNQRPACVKPRPAMEPWPAVAWVLLLTVIADWLKTAQSKDFTEQDIIYLHPSSKNQTLLFHDQKYLIE